MNYTTVEKVKGPFEKLIADDIELLKKHLDGELLNSNKSLVANAISETRGLIRDADSDLISYHERHLILERAAKVWLEVWQHYNHIPEAVGLGEAINQLTDHFKAHSYLYLSLSRINEGKTDNNSQNLERVTSGFLLLSEIIDVFVDSFAEKEIQTIYDSAKRVMSISTRTPWDYFESGYDLSNLTTQLRAYSSLIVLKISERQTTGKLSAAMNVEKLERNPSEDAPFVPAWEKIDGTFADSPIYDSAVQLGREYRESYIPSSAEH